MTHIQNPPENTTHSDVRTYYGETLTGSHDLKTNACCCGTENLTPSVKAALAAVDAEILSRFYGCGSPFPPLLEGCVVLDLGCGTGRDVYAAAKLAGPAGRVIGVDMTEAQLAVARRHIDTHTRRFGYPAPTVEFHPGHIENLAAIGIADNSVDVVISNCVLNLSPEKPRVFAEILRVLKPGGELLFSDVFADRRIPSALRADPVLLGECLGGALYTEDFRRILRDLGCADTRVLSQSPLDIGDAAIEERIGMVSFTSATVRAFKLASLEDRCEDYGQVATYLGSIPDFPHAFTLDTEHRFETHRPLRVCGNTAAMLAETRYAPHFQIHGDRSRHFGLFPCGSTASTSLPPCGNGCC